MGFLMVSGGIKSYLIRLTSINIRSEIWRRSLIVNQITIQGKALWGFTEKIDDTRRMFKSWSPTIVQRNNMQHIKQLPFVLVDALYVDIKDRFNIYVDPVVFFNHTCQRVFVFLRKTTKFENHLR